MLINLQYLLINMINPMNSVRIAEESRKNRIFFSFLIIICNKINKRNKKKSLCHLNGESFFSKIKYLLN